MLYNKIELGAYFKVDNFNWIFTIFLFFLKYLRGHDQVLKAKMCVYKINCLGEALCNIYLEF